MKLAGRTILQMQNHPPIDFGLRKETDSLRVVEVFATTPGVLRHNAILKEAAAIANHDGKPTLYPV